VHGPIRATWQAQQRWTNLLFDRPAVQVVAAARLAFSCFALLAIWLDPTQPERHPTFSYSVLAVFVGHSVAMLAAMRVPSHPALARFAHAVDVTIIGLLIYLTQGPTSPFFVMATFALISATLQWGARGALATAAALVLIQGLVAGIDGVGEIDRFIMRGGYLVIGGALFAYYGAYRERMEERLSRLADWPGEETLHDIPALEKLLEHASAIMRSDRIVVASEVEEYPELFVTVWAKGQRTETHTYAPDVFPEWIAPQLENEAFTLERQPELAYLRAGLRRLDRPAVNEAFARQFLLSGPLVSAPFTTSDARGQVFCHRPDALGGNLLSIMQIIASRIGNRIQNAQMRSSLQQAAVAQERVRLAGDLHDSTMQAMTAAALQLKQIVATENDPAIRVRLDQIQSQLLAQQREIRSFITMLQEMPTDQPVPLDPAIRSALTKVEEIWRCSTSAEISPQNAKVSERMQKQIDFILLEAAANACRHGNAKMISVHAHVAGTSLTLRINNDGNAPETRQIHGGHDATTDATPSSISNRVAGLGGKLAMSSSRLGFELHVTLPLT
jgi:signal transduction histidine kinase